MPENFPHALRELAEANDVNAQYNLGLMYYHGQGVAQNLVLALEWLGRAAERGSVDAQLLLAVMLEEAEPVLARGWCRKAAEQGAPTAQFRLGMMLREAEQETEAKLWLERAALQGHRDAEVALRVLAD